MSDIVLNGLRIGKRQKAFIIAKAGINQNRDIGLAKKMVLAAKSAGVDVVKFQTFYAKDFIQDRTLMYTYKSQVIFERKRISLCTLYLKLCN